MKRQISAALAEILAGLQAKGTITSLPDITKLDIRLAPPKIAGDYSTNIVLLCAKKSEISLEELAEIIIKELEKASWCDKAQFVKPGFINLFCGSSALIIKDILDKGDDFARRHSSSSDSSPKKVLIEYVSTNPTGPLHTGHGRAAAIGSSLAKILSFLGNKVDTEFYVNDWGRQINILTASLIFRALETKRHLTSPILPNMYQGDYVKDMADEWIKQGADKKASQLKDLASTIAAKLNTAQGEEQAAKKEDIKAAKDRQEKLLDQIISIQQDRLGEAFEHARSFVLKTMLQGIEDDLKTFGVEFTNWYYESSSQVSGANQKMFDILEKNKMIYEKEGAKWFKSSKLGDDADRVLVRSNGELTYFGSDIAYHNHKYLRNYDVIIDILGADHHGYVSRIKSSMAALGHDTDKFKVILLQLVFLVSDNKRISMSTRAGKFEELKDLVAQVGIDATRFYYLSYKSDREINFDLDLAVKKTKENPVYYVQYAHARISSLFAELEKTDESSKSSWQDIRKEGLASLDSLDNPAEHDIIRSLNNFIPTLEKIEKTYEVHYLPSYLKNLAAQFHSYYNSVRVLGQANTPARLCICSAVGRVINTGLTLMGINAPHKM